MAYDSTQPTDTTKIRNLGVVIRPNWVAIETGDATFQPQALNLISRPSVPVATDPTVIADTYTMYCKEDANGNVLPYGIGPTPGGLAPGVISQIPRVKSGTTVIAGSGTTTLFDLTGEPDSYGPLYIWRVDSANSQAYATAFFTWNTTRLNFLQTAANTSITSVQGANPLVTITTSTGMTVTWFYFNMFPEA